MAANDQRLDIIFPSVFIQQESVAANLSFSVFGFNMFKANNLTYSRLIVILVKCSY